MKKENELEELSYWKAFWCRSSLSLMSENAFSRHWKCSLDVKREYHTTTSNCHQCAAIKISSGSKIVNGKIFLCSAVKSIPECLWVSCVLTLADTECCIDA